MPRQVGGGLTLSGILGAAKAAERSLTRLRRTEAVAIMFVDLVGSTAYKETHPGEEEWLPRLAAFLSAVTSIVDEHGTVVKYIGDEVMAQFDGADATLNAEHAAERVLAFCARYKQQDLQAKVSLDYGPVVFVDFVAFQGKRRPRSAIRRDPQGLAVDRCARIAKQCVPDSVLASAEFVEASVSPQRWRQCGQFKARGILRAVRVFQMKTGRGAPVVSVKTKPSIDECLESNQELGRQLRALKALRDRK